MKINDNDWTTISRERHNGDRKTGEMKSNNADENTKNHC